jgi:hypothetical protein
MNYCTYFLSFSRHYFGKDDKIQIPPFQRAQPRPERPNSWMDILFPGFWDRNPQFPPWIH